MYEIQNKLTLEGFQSHGNIWVPCFWNSDSNFQKTTACWFVFTGISKLHTYKSYYIDIKSNIEDLEIHCLYFDSLVPGFETEQLIKNLHKSKD